MIERKYRLKRTKIVATIGPSSLSKNKIRKMILAGLNVCRINFSHCNHENALKIFDILMNKGKSFKVAHREALKITK